MSQRLFLSRQTIVLLSLSLTVYVAAILAFVFLEKKSLLVATYFVVVTLSTVGFGDVVPTHPVTIFLVILLIITGISTIALVSQSFVDDLLKRRTLLIYQLPSSPISIDRHVIIVGGGKVATGIAEFLNDRFFLPLIISSDMDLVIEARKLGIQAYHGELSSEKSLEIVNIKGAQAVFTFLNTDNETIDLTLLIRDMNDTVPIYASTGHDLVQKFGELIGITRTFRDEHLVARFINMLTDKRRLVVIPGQERGDNKFLIVLADETYDLSKFFAEYHEIAKVNESIFDVTPKCICEPGEYSGKKGFRAIAVPIKSLKKPISETRFEREGFRKIFVGGYSEHIRHIIDEIAIENSEIDIVVFSHEQEELARTDGFRTIKLNPKNIREVVEQEFEDDDLVLNLFDKMIESIMLTLTIRESSVSPKIFQFVNNHKEADVFKRLGVDSLFSPLILKARAMMLSFLWQAGETISLINPGHHIFEYVVTGSSPILGKKLRWLQKKGYTPMLIGRGEDVIQPSHEIKIEEGDSVILYRSSRD